MFKSRDIAFISVFTALLAAGAYIRIPFPVVPLTLQTLFVLIAAMFLGPVRSAISVSVYLLMGLAGLPVFTSGGGIFYVFSPTFGYLIGFIPSALLMGWIYQHIGRKTFLSGWSIGVAGVILIYICGISYMFMLAGSGKIDAPGFSGIFTLGFAVTILADIFKSAVASAAVLKLRSAFPKASHDR
ncbi:biotin transporter BioY [Candidatus Nomurabacteria bacterium]|nr:biotin transporter BioY [Candidatus Nomurabacteria bacterium]